MCPKSCQRSLHTWPRATCVPSSPNPFLPAAGDNRIIIHGGANTAPWQLSADARAAIAAAGAVLLQREIPEAVNVEVAQVCCAVLCCAVLYCAVLGRGMGMMEVTPVGGRGVREEWIG